MKIVLGFAGKARHGKTTCAQIVKEAIQEKYPDIKVTIQPLAKIMKEQAKNIGWDGEKDEKGRRLLQEISWPVKHYHGEYIYAKWALEAAKDYDIILVDDVRMMAEVKYFTKCANEGMIKDFILVRIDRPNFVSDLNAEQLADISETQLDDYPFEHYIINDGSIDDLKMKLKDIENSLIKEYEK